jgi:hypothetical protein
MPTSTVFGATVPLCNDAEDHLILAEQIAFISDQLADVRQQRRHVSEQAQALHGQWLAEVPRSAERTRLVRDYLALCTTRTTLLHAWGYWCDQYQALPPRRLHTPVAAD